MRVPIILMLAVIILTPANIRDIAHDAAGQLQVAVADMLDRAPETNDLQVAEVKPAMLSSVLKATSDTATTIARNVR